MATYWVTSTGAGSDSGTQANPFFTIAQGLGAIQASGLKGDFVNVIADGTHTLPTIITNITNAALLGTSFSDPGFTIRGTDASGNPAFVTTQGAFAAASLFRLRAGVRYVVVRGFKFDLSTVDPTNGVLIARMRDSTAGPVLMEACWTKGYADNTIGSAVRTLIEGDTTGPPDYGEIRYCYLENCLSPIDALLGSTTKKIVLHHDVVSFTGDWIVGFSGTLQAGTTPVNSSDDVGFYHNTIYVNESASSTIASIFDWGPNGGGANAGTANFHSNYGWINTGGAVTQVFAGTAGSTDTNAGTIGYNTIQFGPSVVAGDNPGGLYEAPWDDGTDPKATDSVAYTVPSVNVFNDVTNPFNWSNVNGTGYTIPLPRDLRALLNLTGSSTGGIPGALPGLGVDMVVDIATSNPTPMFYTPFTITVTASCTGGNATGVTYTAAVPAGIDLISATPSTGSYNSGSGVWTIGSLNVGAPQTLILVVRSFYGTDGLVITFNAEVTAYTPSTDPDLSNNTDSVSVTIGTNEKRVPPSTDNEKILASQSSNEKVLASQTSTEKVVAP